MTAVATRPTATARRLPRAETSRGPGIRLHLNESAHPPLPAVVDALTAWTSESQRYPEFRPDGLRAVIAGHLGVAADRVTVGAGATGVAAQVFWSCARAHPSAAPTVVTAVPTFDGYPILADMTGLRLRGVPLTPRGEVDLVRLRAAVDHHTAAVVIATPHNPTGTVVDREALYGFLGSLPAGVVAVLDLAYDEFADRPVDLHDVVDRFPGVVVLKTFSKAYGLAGLRVGYAVGSPTVIASVRAFEMPFGIDAAATVAVPAALAATDEMAARVADLRAGRRRLAAALGAMGYAVVAGQGNFVYLPGAQGIETGRLLASCGILGKRCGDWGLRLTVGDDDATAAIVSVLRATARSAS